MGRVTRTEDTKKHKPKGIFCLETEWWGTKDRTTVEPVLQLLSKHSDYKVPYIHREIGTREEFEHYIQKWTQKQFSDYPILNLQFHGKPGLLNVGWRPDGRVNCTSMSSVRCWLHAFLRHTGVLAVMGYKGVNDWVESAAFEVLLLGKLQCCSLTKQGMQALDRQLTEGTGNLRKLLDFRLEICRTQ
jgi:hypothetical protein